MHRRNPVSDSLKGPVSKDLQTRGVIINCPTIILAVWDGIEADEKKTVADDQNF